MESPLVWVCMAGAVSDFVTLGWVISGYLLVRVIDQ